MQTKKNLKKNSGENAKNWNPNREELKLVQRLRKSFGRMWVINNMKHDPNYNDMLLNKNKYNVDHIIPVSIFRDIVVEYDLDPDIIRTIINKKENLQLLTKEENTIKSNKGCLFKACQYLMLNGIKLIKEKNHANF